MIRTSSERREEPVQVRSTRSLSGPTLALDDAILQGLAPDGGLYLPTELPGLSNDWAEAESLADVAVRTLAPWWGPDEAQIVPLLRDALPFDAPLKPLSGNRWLLELFHGPTLSFKDVGARTMARLAARALAGRKATATVLVATSGDTGSAVADGFAGAPGVRVALLYPKGMVSEVQERQLITARKNVRAFAVQGDFDACQRMVKEAFRDPALESLHLTSANSINIGRLLPQMLYYLWAGLQLERQFGVSQAPYFVVPSGNLGNLTGAMLAAARGLPVHGFLAAHNANRFFPDVLQGEQDPAASPATIPTLSNAMDVGAPSNFERLWGWYGPDLQARVDGLSVDDDATLARMRLTAEEDGEIVCPHTAVGLEALARQRALRPELEAIPAVVLATAHPAKFDQAVLRATGRPAPSAPALEALREAPTRVEAIASDEAVLREALLHGVWPEEA